MTKIVSAAETVAGIPSGATVASVGVIGWITPDALLAALGERFKRESLPRDLTFYFPVGTGDAMDIRGMDHVAQEGLMKRIVSGSYINPAHPATGRRPELMRLIREDLVEAYSWPIGASMHWLREVARKSPGYITRVGLGTYIDPLHGGGRFTSRAREDLVRRIELDGETLLYFPTWKLDYAFVRASSADEFGNLSFEEEALVSSAVALAIATKAAGGRVIAQVRRIVPRGARPAGAIRIPGVLVDSVVVDANQMMVTDTPFDATYLGPSSAPLAGLPRLPFGADKIIARRAAREIPRRQLCILGFGAASDIPLVMAEDGQFAGGALDDYWFTTEHGSYGGIVMSGWQFSANVHPEALLDGVTQFDVIDGGLCPFTALAFAEYDSSGVVNVSRFGSANPGAGGFIDIAQNAQRLVFTGTFTTGGLNVAFRDGRLCIEQEGRQRKLVRTASHVTYRVGEGVARGQEALLITERAVFRVVPEGLVLCEAAPGIDVRSQIIGQMEFPPVAVEEPLRRMDAACFTGVGSPVSTGAADSVLAAGA